MHCIDPATATIAQAHKETAVTACLVSNACFRQITSFAVFTSEVCKLLPIIHNALKCDKSVAIGTILISHDKSKQMRQNCRMNYALLLSRINERMDALGLSARKTCAMAGVGENTIRNIRAGHAPKPANLHKLAKTLGVPDSHFLEAAAQAKREGAPEEPEKPHFSAVETVYVKGRVQAGLWQDALEWPVSDWLPVYIPADPRFPQIERFGLEVCGPSMNKVYPEGSIIIAVNLDDLGRCPRSGERVVIQCRAKNSSDMEATVKRYEVTQDGQHILWPESYDPLYQTPIILEDLAQDMGEHGLNAGNGACHDMKIIAVVVGSYRPE